MDRFVGPPSTAAMLQFGRVISPGVLLRDGAAGLEPMVSAAREALTLFKGLLSRSHRVPLRRMVVRYETRRQLALQLLWERSSFDENAPPLSTAVALNPI